MAEAAPSVTFLDARLLEAARDLALTARRAVAGALAGLHASQRPGRAHDFSQYRAYQPGDEPRHIDWKLFARSDRYYLREGDVDTRVAIDLVLDATASMQHRDGGPGEPSKFELARAVTAALALLAENQGDPLSLHILADGGVSSVLPAGRRQPFRRVVHALAAREPSGRWPANDHLLVHAIRRAEIEGSSAGPGTTARISVVLTDGHQHGDEIRSALAPLRARRHEVLFFHLIARDECEFPYRGPVRFEEWETGRTVEADASAVRNAYLAAEERERRAWTRGWGEGGFDYLALLTDAPPAPAIRAYLRRRLRR